MSTSVAFGGQSVHALDRIGPDLDRNSCIIWSKAKHNNCNKLCEPRRARTGWTGVFLTIGEFPRAQDVALTQKNAVQLVQWLDSYVKMLIVLGKHWTKICQKMRSASGPDPVQVGSRAAAGDSL